MSLINPSLEHVYFSITVVILVSNHVIIKFIRFVSRFTVHLCNAIYFLTIFNILYKQFTKILYFVFWDLKQSPQSPRPRPRPTRNENLEGKRTKPTHEQNSLMSASPLLQKQNIKFHRPSSVLKSILVRHFFSVILG